MSNHNVQCQTCFKYRVPKDLSSPATEYGRINEDAALQLYVEQENCNVQKCGLFVNMKDGFLAAFPDWLLGTNGLIDVKCPRSKRFLKPTETAKEYEAKNKKKEPGVKGPNHHHSLYYQIQGQLHNTQREFCDFVIFTLKGIDIQRIQRDDTFLSTNIEPFLLKFYMEGPSSAEIPHVDELSDRIICHYSRSGNLSIFIHGHSIIWDRGVWLFVRRTLLRRVFLPCKMRPSRAAGTRTWRFFTELLLP